MSWFKVDDKLHSSRKLLSIPRRHRLACLGLWTMAGSWSADQLTDGHVPDYMIEEWGGTKQQVDLLVKAGLWTRLDDESVFHDWDEYQPTRAEVQAERARNREKLRKWREKKRNETESEPVTNQPVTGLQNGTKPERNPAPDPTRPDPTRPLVPNGTNSSPARDDNGTTANPKETLNAGRRLVNQFIETVDVAFPSKVRNDLIAHATTCLQDGIDPADVARGLEIWNAEGYPASTLANSVRTAQRERLGQPPPGTPRPKRATGTERAITALQLADQFEAQAADDPWMKAVEQ